MLYIVLMLFYVHSYSTLSFYLLNVFLKFYTFRSDGAQPHLVNIQFQKKVRLQVLIFLLFHPSLVDICLVISAIWKTISLVIKDSYYLATQIWYMHWQSINQFVLFENFTTVFESSIDFSTVLLQSIACSLYHVFLTSLRLLIHWMT